MKRKKTIDCTVLMAGAYPFRKGKKISIRKKGDLYYVSSDGKDFGLIKEVCGAEDMLMTDLPERFDGIVVENRREQCLLRVCVAL